MPAMEFWALRLPPELREAIELGASSTGETMSDWVRDAIAKKASRAGLMKKGDTAATMSPREIESATSKQRNRQNVKTRQRAGASAS